MEKYVLVDRPRLLRCEHVHITSHSYSFANSHFARRFPIFLFTHILQFVQTWIIRLPFLLYSNFVDPDSEY